MYLYKQIKMTNVLLTECAHIIRTGKLWESKDQQSEELEPIRACNFTGNSLHHIIKGIIVHPQYIFCIYTLCIYIYIHCVYIYIYTLYVYTVAYLGGACGDGSPPPPPHSESPNNFLTRYTVKNGISNLHILLKSTLKRQEMPFQRSKFQNGISNLYILLRSALKMQEMPFQRPKFRHYGLPLTKILATPL